MLDWLINASGLVAVLLGGNWLLAMRDSDGKPHQRGLRRALAALLLAFGTTTIAAWQLQAAGRSGLALFLLGSLWAMVALGTAVVAIKARWN